jgi:Cd2+/Zn2+-exporting ATPase
MKVSEYYIQKMDCPTEEGMIRGRLGPMKGVEGLEFNLMARVLTVKHTLANDGDIVAAIKALGMDAVPRGGPASLELPVVQPSFWRKPSTILTVVSGVFAITTRRRRSSA